MGPESFLRRWWNAVKPLPETQALDKAALRIKRRQRNLIRLGALAGILLACGWIAYSYVANAPQRAAAEFRKGIALMHPGAYGAAAAHFGRSIEIWPNLPEAYLNRGIASHSLGRPEPAIEDLDRALALDPGLSRAHDEMALIYMETRQPEKALREFDASLRIRPNAEGFYQRGNLYESLGEHQKALEDYDRAISEMVDSPFAYRARAAAREKLGDPDGASADRAKASSLEDDR